MPSLSGLSMAQEEEDKRSLEDKFAAAVKVIRSLPEEGSFQPSDDMMLMFYSYYKQATMGPCDIPRPMGIWDTRSKAKWDAWSALGNMTREEAMRNYVENIQLILEAIPVSDEVSDLVQKLGNFYTEVEGDVEEAEEREVDKRLFTRPFAGHTEELVKPSHKPTMEGYGDLWDDVQNVQEKDGSAHGVSSEEEGGSKENGEIERKESWEWRRSSEEEEEHGDEEDNAEDEEKEVERDWSPDPRRLMAEDGRWRSDTKGSSMSSFTNGTHSSLNTEVEEEELAYSVEPGVRYNPYMHCNGRLSDPSDAVPKKNHRSTDSDNEEFCDSMEHLAMEEHLVGSHPCGLSSSVPGSTPGQTREMVEPVSVRAWIGMLSRLHCRYSPGEYPSWVDPPDEVLKGELLHRLQLEVQRLSTTKRPSPASEMQKDLWFESSATLMEREDQVFREGGINPCQRNSSLSRRRGGCPSPRATCCCGASLHPARASGGNINEQIAAVLLRLQQDMASVLHRLHTLEELTKSQSRSSSPRQQELSPITRKFLRPPWWPCDFSPLTVMLTALWPLIAHWLVQFYVQRKRR
ncbi:acyl-CoA-binding domain-containing protein 5-like [Pholidichthys leucotaenia]